jgi:hypothetical protein
MKKKNETARIILIGILSIAVTLLTIFIFSNATLKKHLQDEQIKSESILSEKLLLDKTIASLKADLVKLKGRNTYLDKVVYEMSGKLARKETEVKQLIAQKASVPELKKKISELEDLKAQLKNELAQQYLMTNQLQAENDKMRKENDQLQSTNAILKSLVADNYRVEAVKGKKEKLTSFARRTDKLIVSFDLPENCGDAISFKIVTPEGLELNSSDNKSMSMAIINNQPNFLACVDETMLIFNSQRVEMYYKPEKKLTKGIYRFNIYNEGKYLGSSQLRLK